MCIYLSSGLSLVISIGCWDTEDGFSSCRMAGCNRESNGGLANGGEEAPPPPPASVTEILAAIAVGNADTNRAINAIA